MRTTFPSAALLVILAFLGASSSRAQFVLPTGYGFSVAPNSDGGGNLYPDSGGELTDGAYGDIFSNYGSAPAAIPWVGWINLAPSITFQFATPQTFSRIEIGTTWGIAGIGLPQTVTISGSTFNLTVSEFTSNTRDWLVFDGNFSTTLDGSLEIDLGNSYASWTMVDEVRFTAIPEPARSAMLISLLAVGVGVLASRRKRLSASAGLISVR